MYVMYALHMDVFIEMIGLCVSRSVQAAILCSFTCRSCGTAFRHCLRLFPFRLAVTFLNWFGTLFTFKIGSAHEEVKPCLAYD
jgi:hypothetical protein